MTDQQYSLPDLRELKTSGKIVVVDSFDQESTVPGVPYKGKYIQLPRNLMEGTTYSLGAAPSRFDDSTNNIRGSLRIMHNVLHNIIEMLSFVIVHQNTDNDIMLDKIQPMIIELLQHVKQAEEKPYDKAESSELSKTIKRDLTNLHKVTEHLKQENETLKSLITKNNKEHQEQVLKLENLIIEIRYENVKFQNDIKTIIKNNLADILEKL